MAPFQAVAGKLVDFNQNSLFSEYMTHAVYQDTTDIDSKQLSLGFCYCIQSSFLEVGLSGFSLMIDYPYTNVVFISIVGRQGSTAHLILTPLDVMVDGPVLTT